mmetsp:Transcript_21197/g.59008  ORF Transcript_21197/g.59008 Transcript_21197/m.59008 type:complete len:465 (-) Transcript_21197:102-1496(-)|eukprot:CAMPEP_0198134408 /NCGR_PEP_ID=MMETSP1442-20131203/60059_1 /TAXON_ID= /ORGANISM="Craspedostauros australis, Strain CCMP3328" /LENGTH=464 /DNA_ID=CAMNT_0043795551 /DNA_START=103 /DNA_END=1497 /DNA_ORIENTATION=+
MPTVDHRNDAHGGGLQRGQPNEQDPSSSNPSPTSEVQATSNEAPLSLLQSAWLGLATATVILFGVGLVIGIALLPILIFFIVRSVNEDWMLVGHHDSDNDDGQRQGIEGGMHRWTSSLASETVFLWTINLALLAAVQVIHMVLVWYNVMYLRIMRTTVLPIRFFLMPIVVWLVMMESIRDGKETMCLPVRTANPNNANANETPNAPSSNTGGTRNSVPLPPPPTTSGSSANDTAHTAGLRTPLLPSRSQSSPTNESSHGNGKRRRNLRRRQQQMKRTFQRARIHHEWQYSESSLQLSQIVPILWQHQRRMCQQDSEDAVSFMEVLSCFVERFLVVFMTPFAVLDLYYVDGDPRQLVCFQLSYRQGKAWYWFMYFCRSDFTRCGIWFHGVRTAIERGKAMPSIHYVNGLRGNVQSKRNAGLDICEPTALSFLRKVHGVGHLPWPVCRKSLERVGSIWCEEQNGGE